MEQLWFLFTQFISLPDDAPDTLFQQIFLRLITRMLDIIGEELFNARDSRGMSAEYTQVYVSASNFENALHRYARSLSIIDYYEEEGSDLELEP